jgi:hypothetical protein
VRQGPEKLGGARVSSELLFSGVAARHTEASPQPQPLATAENQLG